MNDCGNNLARGFKCPSSEEKQNKQFKGLTCPFLSLKFNLQWESTHGLHFKWGSPKKIGFPIDLILMVRPGKSNETPKRPPKVTLQIKPQGLSIFPSSTSPHQQEAHFDFIGNLDKTGPNKYLLRFCFKCSFETGIPAFACLAVSNGFSW